MLPSAKRRVQPPGMEQFQMFGGLRVQWFRVKG